LQGKAGMEKGLTGFQRRVPKITRSLKEPDNERSPGRELPEIAARIIVTSWRLSECHPKVVVEAQL